MRVTRRVTAVVVVVVAMAAMIDTAWAQGKGKPSLPPDALGSITLADRPGDGLSSDGGGAYTGATIYGSGTLRLVLSDAARTMTVNLQEQTASAPSADHVPPGTYYANGDFRIDNIDHAPASGGWVRSVGRLGFGQELVNHAVGFRYTTANGVPVYGTEVCVRRVVGVSPATWVVASSDACSLGEQGNAGLFEEGLKGKGYRFEAVYKVRFEATVVCTSGSTCPQ